MLLGLGLGASQMAAAASDSATLLVGSQQINCGTPGSASILSGYLSAASVGSYSPTGLTGGSTVFSLADDIVVLCGAASNHSILVVSGFAANPGSTWLSSVTCNGVTNTTGGAVGFSYSGGSAQWIWSQLFGLTAKISTNVSCTIVHN